MDARALYNRVMSRESRLKITDDEWLELEKEVKEWLATDPPKEEKAMFVPLGAYEVIGMIADGIHYKRKTGRYAKDYKMPDNIKIFDVKAQK